MEKLLKRFAREIILLHNKGKDGRFPCECHLCKQARPLLKRKRKPVPNLVAMPSKCHKALHKANLVTDLFKFAEHEAVQDEWCVLCNRSAIYGVDEDHAEDCLHLRVKHSEKK